MTVIYGYLDDTYLDDQYLTSHALGSMGFQSQVVINKENAYGLQSQIIINKENAYGLQSKITINKQDSYGFQGQGVINKENFYGFQSDIQILDKLKAIGLQSNIQIENKLLPNGFQSQTIISKINEYGFQATITIENKENSNGIQADIVIIDKLKASALQSQIHVEVYNAQGLQALVNLVGIGKSHGFQSKIEVLDKLQSLGFETRVDKYPTKQCLADAGYLGNDYLEDEYLSAIFCTTPGFQATIQNIDTLQPLGMQSKVVINKADTIALQSLVHIVDYLKSYGFQSEVHIIDKLKTHGFQSEVHIVDKLKAHGFQSEVHIIDKLSSYGFQDEVINVHGTGFQALSTIYNTYNLRILCDFKSRGLTITNWAANSTAPGDFSIQNIDTDIVEQVWRSNSVITGLTLTCDTGLPQGVFLDTLAILNHNLTRSATVILYGSNDPTFMTIGTTITLQARSVNMFYIAPDLPLAGFRYWRFDIDDATNLNGYVEIGSIVFGAANIFHGECFIDELDFELKDFSDTIRTEGFTNVANSRTQKRKVKLDFRMLNFQRRNFTILRDIFENERTVNKCLWIPTPSATDQEVTARFAVFGKLPNIPSERHKNFGANDDYVTLALEVDESL